MTLTSVTPTNRAPADAVTGVRIQLVDATKRFGEVTALQGIDLDVAAGEFTVLLGPSGSGKSTLLRSLAGIERLDEGTIRFDDTLIAGPGVCVAPEKRNLAMVFQDYALWPHLDVQHNVVHALRRRRLGAAATTTRARETLDRVGLGHLATRYPHELSGGEQQRVSLARAIAAQPRLLLFDEPLSSLDADLRERLRVEIATVTRASGCTAVYITHDQSEAFALADTIGVLHGGRLEQLGSPEDIYHRPLSPRVARFTGISGELSGHVVRRDRDTLVVAVGADHIVARGDVAEGAETRVLVRPAATGLGAEGPDSAGLPGEVIDVAYRGRGYDHVVRCHGTTLTSVFAPHAWARGTRCSVTLQPEGCLAYPAHQGGSEATTSEI